MMTPPRIKFRLITVISFILFNYILIAGQDPPTATWESIGPDGGWVYALVQDPFNSNVLYLAPWSDPCRIHKSTDKGNSWNVISQISGLVRCLYADPNSPSVLYAGATGAIEKSTDGGTTWTRHSLYNSYIYIHEITVDPSNSNILHACGDGWTGNDWVLTHYKSTDGGVTWIHTHISDTYGWAYCIAIDPVNSEILYMGGAHDVNDSSEGYLLKSIDGGASWFDITSGTSSFIRDILIDPLSPNKVYIATLSGIYRSHDGGSSWTQNDGRAMGYQLAMEPHDPEVLYAGYYNSCFQSVDGGVNWVEFTNGLFGGRCYDLCVDYASPSTLFFANLTGLFRSSNAGVDWSTSNAGFISANITELKLAPSAPTTLYIAFNNNAIFRTTNAAGHATPKQFSFWQRLPQMIAKTNPIEKTLNKVDRREVKLDPMHLQSWERLLEFLSSDNISSLLIGPTDPDLVYALEGVGSDRGLLFRSTTGGSDWEEISDILYEGGALSWGSILQGGSYDNQTEIVMSVARSDDDGFTWTRSDLSSTEGHVYAIAGDPNDSNIFYAGGYYDDSEGSSLASLFKTTDGGSSWIEIGSSISGIVYCIAVDPFNSDKIYTGTSQGVYVSLDGGNSWREPTIILNARCMVLHPTVTDRLFIGTSAGVYSSNDGGTSWIQVNDGLLNTDIQCIDFDPINSALYVGTDGGGVFRSFYGGTDTPYLLVNPTTLNFGTTTNDLTFDIQNSGGGTLSWNVSEGGVELADLYVERAYLVQPDGDNDISNDVEVPSPAVGEEVRMICKVTNLGTVDADNWTIHGIMDGSVLATGNFSLIAGGTTHIWRTNPWMATTGSHELAWQVDTENVIPESNEFNNTATLPFNVPGGNLNALVKETGTEYSDFDTLWYSCEASDPELIDRDTGDGVFIAKIIDKAWITSISPSSGIDDATVTVSVGRGLLTENYDTGILNVTSNGGDQLVTVLITQTGGDLISPYTTDHSPTKNAINVPTDADIDFHIRDDDSGVDISSIVLQINGTQVTPTIAGTPADYRVMYDPPVDFQGGETVTVSIDARDLAGNAMPTETYSFTVEDDLVSVTFLINAATIPDTLGSNSVVQIRGDADPLTWGGDSQVFLTNIGGDYWQGSGRFRSNQTVEYKVYTNAEHDTVYAGAAWEDQGWEGDFETQNRILNLGQSDTTLELQFVNGWQNGVGQYVPPYTHVDGTFVVWIRVNMQGWQDFDPEYHRVGVRGSNNSDWGETGEISWNETYWLNQESDHVNSVSQRYPGMYFYSGAVHVPDPYDDSELWFKIVVHHKNSPADDNWEHLVYDPSRQDQVLISGNDTTLYWFWFDDLNPIANTHSDDVSFTWNVDMAHAIATNGFSFGDTLMVRWGHLGTASSAGSYPLARQGFSTIYSGSVNTMATLGGRLNYAYYLIKNGQLYREVYHNHDYIGDRNDGTRYRVFSGLTGSHMTIDDIEASLVSQRRMPFFRNVEVIDRDVLVTYTCDVRPAIFQLKAGSVLIDASGASIDITDPDEVLSLGVVINGPATGGWGIWGSQLLTLVDDGTQGDAAAGDSIFTIQIPYTTVDQDVVGQEFRFGIGGGDNEHGQGEWGINHIANINDSGPTSIIASQFGSTHPAFYSAWDYDNQRPVISLDLSPPYTANHNPAPNATGVPSGTDIVVHLRDGQSGVDQSTIVMTVEGQGVAPVITGNPSEYIITYTPTTSFSAGQVVDVTIDGSDLSGTGMIQDRYHFTIQASSDVTLPVITHTPVLSANMGESITLNTTAEDAAGIKTVRLNFRKGGETSYASMNMAPIGGSSYQAGIPGTGVTERGLEYTIIATDSNDNTATDPSGTPHQIRVIVPNLSASRLTPSGAYRMVSVPLELYNRSAGDVFLDDLGSYDIKEWRLYRYQGGGYVEYSAGSIESADPGRSYWLITRQSKSWDTGSGQSVATVTPVRLTLASGWNMIGCPFSFPVSWGNVDKGGANIGNPVAYSGSENEAEGYDYNQTDLSPWQGYLIQNLEDYAVSIDIPALESTSSAEKDADENRPEPGEWEIEIIVEGGKYQDRGNRIGVYKNSKETWDTHDYMEVPAFGDYVRLVFPHEDWERHPGLYSGDFRSLAGKGQQWQGLIQTHGMSGEVRVVFRGLQRLPEEKEIRFYDGHLRRLIDPREEPVYTYPVVGQNTERSIRILVGSEDDVLKITEDIRRIPETLVLYPNFPNPFNSSTMLRFSLPDRSRVSLSVYDVMGRIVRTMIQETEKEAGIHEVIWDGRDDGGRSAGSGIYVVVLRSGLGTSKGKIVLVE